MSLRLPAFLLTALFMHSLLAQSPPEKILQAEIYFSCDMNFEISSGNFDPNNSGDSLWVRGTFNNWDKSFPMSVSAFDSNIYEAVVQVDLSLTQNPVEYNFYYEHDNNGTWNLNPGEIYITGNEPDYNNNGIIDIIISKYFYTFIIDVVGAPQIVFTPDSLNFNLHASEVDTVLFYLTNDVPSFHDPLIINRIFAIDNTGPATHQKAENETDSLIYNWIDIDQIHYVMPQYLPLDISYYGTPLTLQPTGSLPAKDEGLAVVQLPFAIDFYGNQYNQIQVSSNGFITFDMNFFQNSNLNQNIPDSTLPNNLIAAYWGDLDGSPLNGEIYTAHIDNQFIIQWTNWSLKNNNQNLSFQIILYGDKNEVKFVYSFVDESALTTTGVENEDGTQALQIAFNQPYVHNRLETTIFKNARWLSAFPATDTILQDSTKIFNIIADAAELPEGNYKANLFISSNDPFNALVSLPVYVTVQPPLTIETPRNIPIEFKLRQNFPNPFNPSTKIQYTIPADKSQVQVKLEIFNTLGQKLITLVDEKQAAGSYEVEWDGRGSNGFPAASGIYYYRLTVADLAAVRKMLLVR